MKSVLTLFCGIVMCGAFVACGDDEDDNFKKEQTDEEKSYFDRTLASAEVSYKVRLGKDELSIYDVDVEYSDENNNDKSLTMKDTLWTWKHSLTPSNLPAKFVLRAKPTQKEGLNLEENAEFQVGCITEIRVVVKNKYGRVICDCNGLGLSPTGFTTMTGSQIMNPWSSTVSDLFGSLFSTDKKTLEVYDGKIVFNGMTQAYW